jgi:hypothetical protein
MMVCLTNMRTVPAMMNITQIISQGKRPVDLFALRLIELGNRMSKGIQPSNQVMMAADSGETLHADPVMNVFRTFSQLGRQTITTSLEICDHPKFAHNISQASHDRRCNFIVFPVEIGAQTYPKGWASAVAQMLYVKAKCTVGIFGDRGFGVSSATSIMDMANPIPGNNQKVFFPFFGSPDDTEALEILVSMTGKDGVSVEVLLFAPANEALDKFTAMTADNKNVTIEPVPKESHDLMSVINRMCDLNSKDLIVVGHDAYSTLEQEEKTLSSFIDTDCTSSFLVIHKAANETPSIVKV